MPETISLLARVATTTAYTAGNDAVTLATQEKCKTVNLTVAIDTATTVIARINGVNLTLNSGANLGINQLFFFTFQFNQQDTLTIRFGTNCNIQYLLATESID